MEGAGSIVAMIGAFIGAAILLAIGIQILGNVQTATPCASLPGGPGAGHGLTAANSTSWASACVTMQTQTQSSYQLLGISLIVIAAVIVLIIVKLL